ncbi:light-regulated protein 1, chloroplastic-like [Rutidosis leptorrhynchoides]|uniref:light-regulated protein 1, chloroplastic-like n=1 Tax=Rutidosis leptorrhynchoides TaxID=125765 RepID=UPI003A99F86F
MQASIHLSSSPFLPLKATKTSSFSTTLLPIKHHRQGTRTSSTCISIKAAATDVSQVDYSSMASSVFPAEACDTVGGDACNVEMFPETKFRQQQPDPNVKVPPTASQIDREYLQYDSPKTVFIAEACDDLGGEFCEPSYQTGVN